MKRPVNKKKIQSEYLSPMGDADIAKLIEKVQELRRKKEIEALMLQLDETLKGRDIIIENFSPNSLAY